MKSVAVVILNYNGIHLLMKFLNNVILNSPEADIIMIDNNSNDNSVYWFRKNYPKLKCIELKKNLGYSGGYNEGLKHIKNNYYVLLNSDVFVPKNWLSPLLKKFKTDPNVAIMQPHILNQKNNDKFEYAGAAGGFIDKYGIPFCRGRIIDNVEEDLGQYNNNIEIFWASGACFLIRNEVFWKLGGFDPDFFAHQEEIDLCWRAHNQGYKALSIGSSKVYHIGGATLPKSSQKVYLNHRNSLFMLVKNLPEKNKYLIIFSRLILDGFLSANFFLRFKFSYVWAIIRAHSSFYRMLRRMNSKNRDQIKKEDYFFVENINMEYFLKRNRYFNDLSKKLNKNY